ncbi:Tyrosinase [Dactylellina cionopaga]|nr:Tyrosinase [Dactylellina cionopaga]
MSGSLASGGESKMKHILPEKSKLPTWKMNDGKPTVDKDVDKTHPIFKWKVTGVSTGGKSYYRKDINQWAEEDKDQVNLFLIALKQFQEISESDPDSYFMIAGIHGVPTYTDINDIEYRTGTFCHHGALAFPSWHRPYMALIEEYIQAHMMAIAEAYKTQELKEKYIKAATEWRLPYWDPAKIVEEGHYNGTGIPSLITWPQRDVYHPEHEWICISNPLYSYKYHNIDKNGKGGRRFEMKWERFRDQEDKSKGKNAHFFGNLNYTARQPYATNWGQIEGEPTSEQRWQQTQEAYNKNYAMANQNNYHVMEVFREDISFRANVYNSLIEKRKYAWFASTFRRDDESGDVPTGVPLEQVHNTVHDYTGGAGHMGNIPVAAFDPIFWIHHSNIDRWIAIWEKLHGKMEWTEEDAGEAKHPEHRKRNGLPEDPLYPFYKSEEKAWTTVDLQDAAANGTLGYTYKDLELSNEELLHQLARDYDGLAHDLQREPVKSILEKEGDYLIFNDYKATVIHERFALKGEPYVIHFFLGDFDDTSPSGWDKAPARLGSVYNFSAYSEKDSGYSCENCASQSDSKMMSCAEVSITQAIIAAKLNRRFDPSKMKDLASAARGKKDMEQFKDFLHANLNWRVTQVRYPCPLIQKN